MHGMGWGGLFEMLYPMGLYRPKSHYDCKMKYALACNFIACKHACNVPIQRSRQNLKWKNLKFSHRKFDKNLAIEVRKFYPFSWDAMGLRALFLAFFEIMGWDGIQGKIVKWLCVPSHGMGWDSFFRPMPKPGLWALWGGSRTHNYTFLDPKHV